MTDNNNGVWQNLPWEQKVQICEQGRASENHLLHTYVVTFIALEAMLFAILITKGWHQWWSIIITVIGIGLSCLWAYLFETRADSVDRWEVELHKLWLEVGKSEPTASELAKHYSGSVERRERRRKNRWAPFWSLGSAGRFISARWVVIAATPLVFAIVWILVMVVSFAFDC